MTISRLAAAGAIVLNVPMIFAASILPVGAVALSVVLLAAIGAALGAVTAWAISTQPEPAPRRCNAGRPSRRRAHRRLVTPRTPALDLPRAPRRRPGVRTHRTPGFVVCDDGRGRSLSDTPRTAANAKRVRRVSPAAADDVAVAIGL